jgi:hypothetical protein
VSRAQQPDIDARQVRLMQRARAFVGQRHERGADTALDPDCYLNSWANVPGRARLNSLAYGWRAEPARLASRARDVAALLRQPDFSVAGGDVASHFEHLIVSWALPRDFDANGIYRDRYLGLSSSDTPLALWFLMLQGGSPPRVLPPNVRVCHRAARRMAMGSGGHLSSVEAEARRVAAAVGKLLAAGHFRQVVMPYEAQPFQHAIILAAKAHCPGVTTVGYLHSALPALPTDFLFRSGAPDRLLVHGRGQGEILSAHLGWPADQLETIPSLRFLRSDPPTLAGRILLPYAFDDADLISHKMEAYMANAPRASMPAWEVRNHPVMVTSKKHLALTTRLQGIIRRHSDRISTDERMGRQTLMIGATAAVVEALERGLDVVHVCTDALFEKHSSAIWTHLDVEELAADVYRYRLRQPGAYIQLGEAPNAALKILENHSMKVTST